MGMYNHAYCCMSPHLDMCVSLEPCPGVFLKGVKCKIPVTGKDIMKIKLQADGGNGTEELIQEYMYIPELRGVSL
jgi:hypothetical protein